MRIFISIISFLVCTAITPCFGEYSSCYLKAQYDRAKLLSLDDGSLWKIENCESHKTQDWISGDEIRIEKTGSPLFPFALVNVESNSRVYATLK